MTVAHGFLGLVLGLPLAAAPPAEGEVEQIERLAREAGATAAARWQDGGGLAVLLSDLKDPRKVFDRLKRFHQVRHLEMPGCAVTDEDLAGLGAFAQLRSLDLSGTGLRGEGLAHLHALPALEALDLSGTKVGDGALRHLKQFPALRHLRLRETPVTDRGMEHLRRLRGLRCLNLAQTALTDRGVRLLLERTTCSGRPSLRDGRLVAGTALPALEELDISGTKLTDAGLVYVRQLPRLRALSVEQTAVTEAGLRSLALRRLGHLALSRSRVSDGLLRDLAAAGTIHALPNAGRGVYRAVADAEVTELDLKDTSVTNEGLRFIRGLTGLRALYLEGTAVTGRGLRHLRGLPALECLRLEAEQLTDDTLGALADVHLLHAAGGHPSSSRAAPYLPLGHSPVTDAGLRHLSGLRTLVAVDLTNTEISDAGLAHLRPCTRLQTLILNGTAVGSSGLAHLAPLKELNHLALDSERLDDDILLTLQKLGLLHALAQASPERIADRPCSAADVRWLALRWTKVTDRGLEAVLTLPDLEILDLTGARITGAGLARLRGLKKLRNLALDDCPLTDEDLRHLQALPQLTELSVAGLPLRQAGLREIAKLPRLRYLNLRRTGVPAPALHLLAPLRRQLRTLTIEEGELTDEVLHHLASAGLLHTLRNAATRDSRGVPLRRPTARYEDPDRAPTPGEVTFLTLKGTRVSDAGLGLLAAFPNLQTLDLTETSISAAGLLHLEPLHRLRTLQLDEAQLTDEAIEALAGVGLLHALDRAETADGGRPARASEVVALNLAGTAVSDGALRHLDVVSGLRRLDLSGTRVRDRAVLELKRKRPELVILR